MTMTMFDDPKDYRYLKDYTLITNPQDVGGVLSELDKYNLFALDTETTSLNWVIAQLHGISFATADREWYVTGSACHAILPGLRDLVRRPNKTVAMHNARYDMHMLLKYNVVPNKIFDTSIAQFLINENQRLALKLLAYKVGIDEDLPTYTDLVRRTAKRLRMKQNNVSIEMIPLNEVAPYAARDTRITYDLVAVSLKEMKDEDMLEIFWENEMPMMWVLLAMEEKGVALDIPRLEKMVVDYSNLQEMYAKKIMDAGIENPNSNDQLAEYLYTKKKIKPKKFTDSESPATDIIALQRVMSYKDGEPDESDPITKFLLTVLNYRKATKLLGTYIQPLLEKQNNGRIHTQYNSIAGRDKYGTVTSRLTSSNPNLQNIPGVGIGAELREVFIAPENHTMVVVDYSQLELRILAHYTRDAHLIKVFKENGDPHQMTADRIGIGRKYAKSVNFGWAYGIGGRTLADTIEKAGNKRPSERDATKWLDGFGNAYPGAEKWKRNVIVWARKLGYVRTIDGHKRRLPDINSKLNSERSRAERQAPNAVIQGTAASIMRYVMIRDKEQLADKFGSIMVQQVHDELMWECPTNVVNEMAKAGQRLMESVEDVFDFRVPILAEPGLGRSWGEAK